MKRIAALFAACLLLACVICLPASAESAASRVDVLCTVNSDGSCIVSMNVMLRLEAAHQYLTFPLPADARNVTLNGSPVSSTASANTIDVDISRITRDYVGSASLQFQYTQPEVVKVEKNEDGQKELVLRLPLLCGFEFPVELLSFTITMPTGGSATMDPKFTSIYRQESVGSDLNVTVSGSQIIGSSKAVLNDHDGVTMTMIVPGDQFPTVSTYIREGEPELVPMLICAGAALLYWLIFLFTLPLVRRRTSTPPEGMTAGEMGCCLTLAGADLTAMVFTWAQLGYLLIHLDGNNRVLLHKRMDMGNERSPFENKVFNSLFGKRRMVDATGEQYADLCQHVATLTPSARTMYKGTSGNTRIFRGIACIAQVFCGICVSMNMTQIPVLQVILSIILGILALVTAWLIQGVPYRQHLRGKVPVYLGLAGMVLWILLGLLCGQVWIPLLAVTIQFLCGYLAAYGGRRSDMGRYNASLVLGFRSYVKHLPRYDISRLLKNDPDYFFNLAPYALALGVLNPFAEAFGRRTMDQCPYLMTQVHGKRPATEWARLIIQVADMMDARSRRMQVERFIVLPNVTIQFGRR